MTVDQLLAQLRDLCENGVDYDRLHETAVQELSRLDPRFHWTGIYELFSDNVLRLGPYVGSPTDHVFIGVGNGVCRPAAAEKRNLNIPDVREIPNYLACSAETRSELVVLIRTCDRIHAQIDIDSHPGGAFTDDPVAMVPRVV